ncbi:MAG: type II toxin-antitoxin system RelE/ParE family toxin [Chitinophagaceae bacterium]
MANRKISWDKGALQQFNQSIDYIAKTSLQNAEKVRIEILGKIEQLIHSPELSAPDKYKTNNDGSYRAFELHRHRIAYYVSGSEIRILRVRHTSREPKMY